MSTSSDFSQLQQARAFDLQTLGAVYDRYSPLVYRCAYRLLNDPQLAEDCVAEAFGQLLHALGRKGEKIRDIESYLMQMGLKWVDGQLATQSADLAAAHGLTHERIEAEDVRLALQTMPAEARNVLVLKFLESWDDQQIAAALDVPIQSLHERYQQALHALRQHLHLARLDGAVETLGRLAA